MIQRVQSVYLLLITILMSIFVFAPYAQIVADGSQTIEFYSFAVRKTFDTGSTEIIIRTLPLILLIIIAGATAFLDIFLFRKRIFQIRICILISILLIAQLILIYIHYTHIRHEFSSVGSMLKLPVIFPVISIILVFMAYRGIKHDEIIVNSYNRIR